MKTLIQMIYLTNLDHFLVMKIYFYNFSKEEEETEILLFKLSRLDLVGISFKQDPAVDNNNNKIGITNNKNRKLSQDPALFYNF